MSNHLICCPIAWGSLQLSSKSRRISRTSTRSDGNIKKILAGQPGMVSLPYSSDEGVKINSIFLILHISPNDVARRIKWNLYIGL